MPVAEAGDAGALTMSEIKAPLCQILTLHAYDVPANTPESYAVMEWFQEHGAGAFHVRAEMPSSTAEPGSDEATDDALWATVNAYLLSLGARDGEWVKITGGP